MARERRTPRVKVGYLHIGREGGGVRRYGSIIAEAARERPDLEILEADGGDREATKDSLTAAGRALKGADVVHIQWKPNDWGGGRTALKHLKAFMNACPVPMIVTLHDVWEREGIRERWLDPDVYTLRGLGRRAARVTVHSEEERRRLAGFVAPNVVEIVPHFVEQRTMVDAEAARQTLGLSGKRVVTILGFMVQRKGYRMTVDALPSLPDDVVALFAGGPMPGREVRADELRARATELGVADRLLITGYVGEDRLDAALAATQVALCPFRDLSASGSLSTWISTGRPIIASDLPQFREYDAMVPGALRIFEPLTADGLAAAIRRVLDEGPPLVDPKVVALGERLATPRIVERFAGIYRAVVAAAARG